MVLSIVLGVLTLALDGYFGYLLYTHAGPWYSLFAILFVPFTFVLLFGIWVVILAIWGAFLNTKKKVRKPSPFYYSIVRNTDVVLLTVLRVHIIVRGEKIPLKTRFAIVSNHVSGFDHMVMMRVINQEPMVYITKPSNLHYPIAGPFLHHAGFIPIHRHNMVKGVKDIELAGEYLRDRLCSVAVAPEGTRNKTDELLLPFHPGSFRLAQIGEAPLVIACIKGTKDIRKRTPWRATTVYFDVLEIIPYEEHCHLTTKELADHAAAVILEDLKKEE